MDNLNLQFDTMTINTSLAEQYVDKHESILRCNVIEVSSNDVKPFKSAFKELAKKFEENAELFAQLEYRFRKIPKEEVKTFDIKLLIQNCLYWISVCEDSYMKGSPETLFVDSRKPLSQLGIFAAYALRAKDVVNIIAGDDMFAACHLFQTLCSEAGLKPPMLTRSKTNGDNVERLPGSFWSYGIGVVTDRSDLDSAVDKFLASTDSCYPWKLRRVLVQESTYQEFKNTLSWKCALKPSEITQDEQTVLCSKVFRYKQKLFLLDFAGNPENLSKDYHPIIVESYRTTKELLSLLTKHEASSLSVWCNDISEANQIAFTAKSQTSAQMIWINDFANFDGTPLAAQAYHSLFYSQYDHRADPLKILTKLDAWKKMSLEQRFNTVKKALEKSEWPESANVLELVELVFTENYQIVSVEKGIMCISFEEPCGMLAISCEEDKMNLAFILSSVVKGNGISYVSGRSGTWENIFQCLMEERAPITFELSGQDNFYLMYLTKTVWTKFGTTFAN